MVDPRHLPLRLDDAVGSAYAGVVKERSERCRGCGVVLTSVDGPTHPYMLGSAACWEVYGEILAGDYGERGYPPIHRLVVDTYAVQHPGQPDRRAIQSVRVHLMSLYLVLEQGFTPERARRELARILKRATTFRWLDPPKPNGTMTVVDVARADDYAVAARQWAGSVWDAWGAHHETVEGWVAKSART